MFFVGKLYYPTDRSRRKTDGRLSDRFMKVEAVIRCFEREHG